MERREGAKRPCGGRGPYGDGGQRAMKGGATKIDERMEQRGSAACLEKKKHKDKKKENKIKGSCVRAVAGVGYKNQVPEN